MRTIHAALRHGDATRVATYISSQRCATSLKFAPAAKTVLIYAAVYAVMDYVLNAMAFGDGWIIIWPVNGITIALLLMQPKSRWFCMLLGIQLGTAIGDSPHTDTFVMALCDRFCSVLEVLICVSLLPAYSTMDTWLRTPHVFRRFVLALLVGPGVAGVIAATLYAYLKHDAWLPAFNNWATADALGIAATMPLALSVRSTQMRSLFEPKSIGKTVAVLIFALAGAGLIFSVSSYPLEFLLLPLLMLVDSILAFAGSAISVVGVMFIVVYCTNRNVGPFAVWSNQLMISRDLALQIFFGFTMMALFPASVLLTERQRLADALRDSNRELGERARNLEGLTLKADAANRKDSSIPVG